MCFVWISEQTAIISPYNINWLVFITETESVYCAVRPGYLSCYWPATAKCCTKLLYLIYILVLNQLDAQNLFYNKFYYTPLHVSSTCSYHQEVKIALHSLWYHHTYRCDDTRGCVVQFWPPDDEHMCSKHVETWNKTYGETNFVHQVG